MTDVVTAVADAETALNTVVAIRDRVINAYQDIIKMPV
jgi:flagellar hook-basal body complex protein FliE